MPLILRTRALRHWKFLIFAKGISRIYSEHELQIVNFTGYSTLTKQSLFYFHTVNN